MRLLLFNLAVDADHQALGFATGWIRAIAERVDRVHVITMRVGRVEVPDNVIVHSLGKEKEFGEGRRLREFYRHLWRVLTVDRVDACFSHMMPLFTVLGAPLLKMRGVPIVTWYAHRQVSWRLRLAHHMSDLIVTTNQHSYRYRRDKVLTVGQGINTRLFRPNHDAPEAVSLLVSAGRLSPIKDLDVLLDACRILRDEGFKFRCALVGAAPEEDSAYELALRERVTREGMGEIVQFAGAVPNEQIVQWFWKATAHVNLCPTGAPDKAALEAMACEVPSIVANEGFRESLGEWAERLMFRHGDARDLAGKLRDVLRLTEADRQRMGEDLRRSVVAHHSLERLADMLVDLLEDLRKGGSWARVCERVREG